VSEMQTAPRLYLDTADLLDIADCRVDSAVVDALLGAIETKGLVTIFTLEHLLDMQRMSVDEPGKVLGDVARRFGRRAVVSTEPHEVEPWHEASADIVLELVRDPVGLFTHPAAASVVERFGDLTRRAHQGDRAIQDSGGSSSIPISGDAEKLFAQCMITLVRGWMGSDIDGIVSFWAPKTAPTLTAGRIAAVRRRLEMFRAAFIEVEPLMDEQADARDHAMANMLAATDPARSPGLHLMTKLSAARTHDGHRAPKASDAVDGMHAVYFPYVDIATCDKFTHTHLERAMPTVAKARPVQLLRTKRLEQVLEAIGALRSGSHP
jgi:uncharacterized protein (DUF2384 family)